MIAELGSLFCERNSAARQVSHPPSLTSCTCQAPMTHLDNLIELLDRFPRIAKAPAVSAVDLYAPPGAV